MRVFLLFSLLTALINCAFAGNWQPLNHQPALKSYDLTDPNNPIPTLGGVDNPRLLTDGRVLVQNIGVWATPEIWVLTPDEFGSYVNGTWSQVASMPYNVTYPASAVLGDGRVVAVGGEYINWNFIKTFTNQCSIYDPKQGPQGTWTVFTGPSFFVNLFPFYPPVSPTNPIGEVPSVVLSNGTLMIGDKRSRQAALLDAKNLVWRETGTATKFDVNNEEGWTLLPNGKVLTIDSYSDSIYDPVTYPLPADQTNSELYDPLTERWSSAGSTKVPLGSPSPTFHEMGITILRPDGTVFAAGDNGNTSIYNSKTGKWQAGPMLPNGPKSEKQLGVADGPSALLPNGNVLFAASSIESKNHAPVHFFEFDGSKFIEQPTIPNAISNNPSFGFPDASWMVAMVVLPTGQVLLGDTSNDVEIYTSSDQSYNPDWAPRITSSPTAVKRGNTYKITGIRFNGMSQGAAYGDEEQSASNYPLVRITNLLSGHVRYCRTHDHSFMGVASNNSVYTYFDVPNSIDLGDSKIEVVANGIPSPALKIRVTP